jgi:hypothetical protein
MEQEFEQLIEGGVSALFHFFRFDRADRMLHDQDGRIGSTEGFPFRLCERFKRMRDYGDSEPASLLQFDGIVDTPRCARPSISQTADDEVSLSGKVVEVRFRGSLLGGKLASPHNARHIAVLFE